MTMGTDTGEIGLDRYSSGLAWRGGFMSIGDIHDLAGMPGGGMVMDLSIPIPDQPDLPALSLISRLSDAMEQLWWRMQAVRDVLAAVTGFDALYSWCERVDGRQYSCVSVAAKGDLLLQMYSVANTLNDAKVTLGRFLGLSAAQLAG